MFASTAAPVLTVRTGRLPGGKTGGPPHRQRGMTTFETQRPRPGLGDGPPADVTDWRRCRLIEAGFPLPLAAALARKPDVDIHELLQLVDRGCPPELAARILAPPDVPT